MITLLSLAYEYSYIIGFQLAVQLFAPPTNAAPHLAEKIHFINLYYGCQQCAYKYYGL